MASEKVCPKCRELLPADRFYIRAGGPGSLASRCKRCHRDEVVMAKFGLSRDDVISMINSQGGACAICSEALGGRRQNIDHDHVTGAVRGLLCTRCNNGLGQFRDSTTILLKAVDYLNAHRAK